jgi:23S rRNA (guanosine2251-2'-O)-methyltransferase
MKGRRPAPGRHPQKSRSGGPSGPRSQASSRRPASGRESAEERSFRGPSHRDPARWVIGIHSCEETLKVRPRSIREIWLREKWEDSQQLREIADTAKRAGLGVTVKPVGVLEKLGSGHQGIALAVLQSPEADWETIQAQEKGIVIVLDGIEDPHNLGSILRTAWLTGVSAVVIPSDRAVGLTPTVCKIASGGAEHVPVEVVPNLSSFIEDLKKWGFWTYGLSEKGERVPWDFKLDGRVAWVVGSEGTGLRIPTERACDELVRIPQVSSGSSYNASIALAMALMETTRQLT